MRLYRAISQAEQDDYNLEKVFRTAQNTLEAKQFFKSRAAVKQFVSIAHSKSYHPPYKYLMIIEINEADLNALNAEHMKLDGFEAVTVQEDDLHYFNNCVKFVREEVL